ncbi:MAG: glycosyltransferase family 87 protein [Ktedonobacteraceae bacterium]
MAAMKASRLLLVPETEHAGRYPWWRSLALFLLLLLSIALYGALITVAPQPDAEITPFLHIWILCFLPYFAACALILATRPITNRWRWIELGIILMGALIFRAMVLPLPPGLSHDSWRYLWDARVTLHGYSPYVYPPDDKMFSSLQDQVIYANSRYRNSPTIYPPGAQAVYLLSYVLAPSNLYFLKGIFIGFDMLTCGILALLLVRKGLDPRRIVIYAWCPLPIVEFALQGHVDVITLTFTVLSVLSATSTRRGSRVLTGFFIGMATLTKIYPILLLVAIMRRRDWALLATCLATIILGYIPYLILGHGQVLGYFFSYSAEQGGNAGVIHLLTYWVSHERGYELATTIMQQHIVDGIVVCGMSLVVLLLRLLKGISIEAGTILLIGTFLAISAHVFPWYVPALLPWITILTGPVWTRRGPSPKGLAVGIAWYFVCISLTGYFFNNTRDWHIYYQFVYDVVMAGLSIALMLGIWGELKHLYRLTLEGKAR